MRVNNAHFFGNNTKYKRQNSKEYKGDTACLKNLTIRHALQKGLKI